MIKKLLVGTFLLAFSTLSFSMPTDNYLRTCHSCRHFKSQLSCICKDQRGYDHETSLYSPQTCVTIQNINGQLQCTRKRAQQRYLTKDYPVGPIWNQQDAQTKCPPVCISHRGKWTGQWRTVGKRASVCQCRRRIR